MGVTSVDYHDAVRNPMSRQQFLDEIDLEHCTQYVHTVEYVDCQEQDTSGRSFLMITTPSLISCLFVPKIRSKISVFPEAFSSSHPTVDDFIGTLIDHEGYHARENYENPSIILPSLWRLMIEDLHRSFTKSYFVSPRVTALEDESEVRALRNQLSNPNKRKFSSQYLTLVGEMLERKGWR